MTTKATAASSTNTDAGGAACLLLEHPNNVVLTTTTGCSITTTSSASNLTEQPGPQPAEQPISSSYSTSTTTPLRRNGGGGGHMVDNSSNNNSNRNDPNDTSAVKQKKMKRQERHPFMPFAAEQQQQQSSSSAANTPPPTLRRRHSSSASSSLLSNAIVVGPSNTSASSGISKSPALPTRGVGVARGTGGRPWLQRVLARTTTGHHHHRFGQHKNLSALEELQQQQAAATEPDPVGQALTRILNQHDAFNGGCCLSSSSSLLESTQQHCFSYPPLLSRHNYMVAQTKLQAARQLSWPQLGKLLWQRVVLHAGTFVALPLPQQERRGFYNNTMQAVVWWQIVWVLVVCWLLCVSLLTAAHGFVSTTSTCVAMLVDVHDVQLYFYYYSADLVRATCQLGRWLDCYILRGIRFQGREWNCHKFVSIQPQSKDHTSSNNISSSNDGQEVLLLSSSESTLWALPPPPVTIALENGNVTTTRLCCVDGHESMKERLLKQSRYGATTTTTTTTAWSIDTLDHVVAIDFCHLLLHESRINEQRERQEKRRLQHQQKKNKQNKHKQQLLPRRGHRPQRHSLSASELKLPQLDEEEDHDNDNDGVVMEDQNDDDDNDEDAMAERRRRRRLRARSDSTFLSSATAASHAKFGQEDAPSNGVVIIRQVASDDYQQQQLHSDGDGSGNFGTSDDDNHLVAATTPVEAIELKVCGSQDEYQQQKRRRRQQLKRRRQQQKDNSPTLGGKYSWPDDEHTFDDDDDNDHPNNINSSGIFSRDDDDDDTVPMERQYNHEDVKNNDAPEEDHTDESVSCRGMNTPNRRGRAGRRAAARGAPAGSDEYDYHDDQYSDDPFSVGSDDFSPSSSNPGGGGGGRRTRASSMSSSEAAGDRPWLDVGAEIGLKLLNSAHVHRAVASQETTERIIMGAMETTSSLMREKAVMSARASADGTASAAGGNQGTSDTSGLVPPGATASSQVMLAKPIHPMWTSPGAAMLSSLRDHDVCSDYSSTAPPYSAFGSPPVSPRFSLPSLSSTPQQQQQPRTPKHASVASTLTPKSQVDEKARPPLSPNMPSPGVIRRVLRRRPSQDNALMQKQRIALQQQQPVSPVPSISTWATWSPSDQKRHLMSISHPLQQVSSPKTQAEEAKTTGSMWSPMGNLPAMSSRLGVGPVFGDAFDMHPSLRLDQPEQSRCVIIPPTTPREPLAPGVKVAIPILPNQPTFTFSFHTRRFVNSLVYQMGTVVSSQRIFVGEKHGMSSAGNENDDGLHHEYLQTQPTFNTNCLSVTVKLEKSFLRNGEFADLTFRVMDSWSDRFMPKHSKVPIGACVATSFGIGVLVGWRVEDDCHVVRSLWHRRGTGAANGYLNRSSIHGVVEAAVGFRVETTFGCGETIAYVGGGPTFESGRYLVSMKQESRQKGGVIEVNRNDILSCHGAQFIPVIEYIREAAHFQIQLDTYQAAIREQEALSKDDSESAWTNSVWKMWSEGAEILWTSFLKAVEEDKEFDDGVNSFMISIIDFLERLDGDTPADEPRKDEGKPSSDVVVHSDFEVECVASGHGLPITVEEGQEPAFWIMNDFLGGIFNAPADENHQSSSPTRVVEPMAFEQRAKVAADPAIYYGRAFAVLRTLMKTVSIARAGAVDNPDLRLGLAIFYDCLVFVRTIVKVLRKNDSRTSMEVWNRALDEIASTFGPIKERLQKIGQGIAQRMEKQGRRAKIRVLNFVDTLLGDERLILALEQGDWEGALVRLELALIKAKIIEKENLIYYRKAAGFIYGHLRLAVSSDGGAATRNNQKLAVLAQAVQWIASPRRSILKIFERNDVLDFFERILVRVFHKEEVASRMLVIHASNFYSLRHLRLLKDVSTSGRLWMPVLDAADEEFSWVVSHLPENTKELISPLASLFSLCVAEFHSIGAGDLSSDWMDFLLADEAVQIIHNIDMKLILALEAFSRDVKEMMLVLPYYSSIDDDILNLMDEVDLDQFLKEASDAMDDQERLAQFCRAKVTFAIERFLNYLPRMSIPVEKRDLVEGWVLTCRGEDGGDLTLSDVTVKRENLVCQIMGGDILYFPMFGDDASDSLSVGSSVTSPPSPRGQNVVEESVLDHIGEMLLEAQRNGCWKPGVGGIGHPPTDRYVATALHGLPVSAVLNCGIELWRNLEIDDDELLEIAIRDVSFQIRLQKEREEAMSEGRAVYDFDEPFADLSHGRTESSLDQKVKEGLSSSFDNIRRRFNPRVDPTVLFLEMRNLTLQLDKFLFRIEKNEKRTILDPVFEGKGTLTIKNVSIRLRVECAKERAQTSSGDMDAFVPILLLRELTISVENISLKVKDTGFGSDWLLNKAVDAFADDITKVVEDNLRDQIQEQARKALDNLNSYFLVNPNMLLSLLGISMDDLENHVVWV